MKPDGQLMDVDVLADRHTLRQLLEVCQGKGSHMRLDLHVHCNTLIIVRNKEVWRQYEQGGYGNSFQETFTTPAEGMEDTTHHYRAIRYPMGPLNVVCRYAADAYDDGMVVDPLAFSNAKAVKGLPSTKPFFWFNRPFVVQRQGHIVPTTQIVELRARVCNNEEGIIGSPASQERLWFGRTSLSYIAPVSRKTAVVVRVKTDDARDRVMAWEATNQESFRKLVTLLDLLRTAVKSQPGLAAVLMREGSGQPLTICSMQDGTISRQVKDDVAMRHWKVVQERSRWG